MRDDFSSEDGTHLSKQDWDTALTHELPSEFSQLDWDEYLDIERQECTGSCMCGLCQELLNIQNLYPAASYASYEEYLKSDLWNETRRFVKELYGDRCANRQCRNGCHVALEVHHLEYGTWGREHLSEIVPVCKACHRLLHRYRKWLDR